MMSQTSKQFRISIARAWVSALMRVNEILRARALINPHARVTRARRHAESAITQRLRPIARADRARARQRYTCTLERDRWKAGKAHGAFPMTIRPQRPPTGSRPRSATPNKSPALSRPPPSLSLSLSLSVTSALSTPIRPSLRNHLVERPNKSDRRDWRALSIKNDETERRGRARSLARSRRGAPRAEADSATAFSARA